MSDDTGFMTKKRTLETWPRKTIDQHFHDFIVEAMGFGYGGSTRI